MIFFFFFLRNIEKIYYFIDILWHVNYSEIVRTLFKEYLFYFLCLLFCYFVRKINYLLFYSTLVCYVNFDFIAKYKDIFLYPIIIKY